MVMPRGRGKWQQFILTAVQEADVVLLGDTPAQTVHIRRAAQTLAAEGLVEIRIVRVPGEKRKTIAVKPNVNGTKPAKGKK
jgi:hypothetical protein